MRGEPISELRKILLAIDPNWDALTPEEQVVMIKMAMRELKCALMVLMSKER